MKLFAATSLCLVLAALNPAHGQDCTPQLEGLQTGPYCSRGPSSVGSIYELMPVDDGDSSYLIAAGRIFLPDRPQGNFEQYNTTPIARYQNGKWASMDASSNGIPLPIFCASITRADFSSVGGAGPSMYALMKDFEVRSKFYRWNGASWDNLASPASRGYSLLPHADEQGPVLLLSVEGTQGILAWRGEGAWTQYAPFAATPSTESVTRLRSLDDGSGPTVFAMGRFLDTTHNLKRLVKLVGGVWTQYDLPPAALASERVTDIAVFDDGTSATGPETYIAWQQSTSQSAIVSVSVARRRNGTWETLLDSSTQLASPEAGAALLNATIRGVPHLYLATGSNLYEWTSSGWVLLSSTMFVRDIENFNDGRGEQTYFGGYFTDIALNGGPRLPAYGLARMTDHGFASTAEGFGLGTGANDGLIWLYPINLPGSPKLMVSGDISRAGGNYANFAMFDGAHWSTFTREQAPIATTVLSATSATIDGQTRTVIGGGRRPAHYWNGTQWQPLAGVPNSDYPILTSLNGTLYSWETSLQRYTGSSWETVATGPFTSCVVADLGNGPRILLGAFNAVFEFDGANMTRLTPENGPTTGAIRALAVVNDGPGPRIYAYIPLLANKIARLTNGAWEELPPGVHTMITNTALAIASFDDGGGPSLYVTGHSRNTVVTGPIARWRNNAWSTPVPPAAIQTTSVFRPSMAVVGDRLYIGGIFARIENVTADHLAWIQACPRICTADVDGDNDPGSDADIQAFFACLAGTCCTACTADFNNDGDTGTDADIESFFRVLAGGSC